MTPPPVKTSPASATSVGSAGRSPPPTQITHTLVSGDTFRSIANRYHVREADLIRANPGLRPTALRIGAVLTVPLRAAEAPSGLSRRADHQFTEAELAPVIRAAAERHGVSPTRLASIIHRESRFKNHTTHADGTGVGLIGLDPSGELENFRRWACPGTRSDRPADRAARMATPPPPELQIEYLAMRLSELTAQHGGLDEATAAWNTGRGVLDGAGQAYVDRVRARRAELTLSY